MMISLQTSAQRAASCCSGTDNVTKRIVTSNGSRFSLRIRQDTRQEAGPRLLKKIHLKENITSYFTPQAVDTDYWPVISDYSPATNELTPLVFFINHGVSNRSSCESLCVPPRV
jgi:hypothetical protein